MIDIRQLLYVGQEVVDRPSAAELYGRAFGAPVFYEGKLGRDGPDVSLLLIGDLCLSLTDAAPDLDPYVSRYGGRLRSIGFRVTDLAAAVAHLEGYGLRLTSRSTFVATDPQETGGVAFEFIDHELPGDPRLKDETLVEPRSDPLGIQALWHISTLAYDIGAWRKLWTRALGTRELGVLQGGGEYSKANYLHGVGPEPYRTLVSLVEPAEDSELLDVMERQGKGIHAVMFDVADLPAAGRHLRSQRIGLFGSPETRYWVHPASVAGARYILMGRTHAQNLRDRWNEWGLGLK